MGICLIELCLFVGHLKYVVDPSLHIFIEESKMVFQVCVCVHIYDKKTSLDHQELDFNNEIV